MGYWSIITAKPVWEGQFLRKNEIVAVTASITAQFTRELCEKLNFLGKALRQAIAAHDRAARGHAAVAVFAQLSGPARDGA
jgi:hypothetical protein